MNWMMPSKKTQARSAMAFKFKTLIVFDTNALRSTEKGEVAYSFFTFGQPYQRVEDFIETNHL